jgi:AraC-like DNA-binding protein
MNINCDHTIGGFMTDLRYKLAKIITLAVPGDGVHKMPVPNTYCVKFSHLDCRWQRWHASLCVVAQGCTEIMLDSEVYRYDGAYYIATPVELPVSSRLFAVTPAQPFLCIKVIFDSITLNEIAAQIEKDFPNETGKPQHAMFIGEASDKMLDAAIRLGKLFQVPEDAPILGPLVTKEMFYYLLKGPDGSAIRQFVRSGSKMYKVSQVIYMLRTKLSEEMDISYLAKTANMSRSAFFKAFKEATAMSPIQYQKRLRLMEARRLMIIEGETAESSAFRVGYNSASQFSREYSRMFGNSPLRDVMLIKKAGDIRQLF